jgi:hypothetical protein
LLYLDVILRSHYKRRLMKLHLKYGIKSLAIVLSFLIALPALPAQTLAPPAQTVPTQLNIVVVEGEGTINNVRQRVTHEPIVRVEDENHRPIGGAVVVFTLPTEGATGQFGNSGKTLTVMTDSQGQAVAKGLKPNLVSGKLPIYVTASYRGLTMTQFNEGVPGAKAGNGGGHGALIGILVAVGAAAAGGGAYFATRNNKTSSPVATPTGPTPIGITPGTGTIVGGH